jgi:hypothetical protein
VWPAKRLTEYLYLIKCSKFLDLARLNASKDAVWVNGNSCQGQETRKWIGAKQGEVGKRDKKVKSGKEIRR